MGRKKGEVKLGQSAENSGSEMMPEAPAGNPENEMMPEAPAGNPENEMMPETPAGNLQNEIMTEIPAEDSGSEIMLEASAGEQEAKKDTEILERGTYRITCCNPINEAFGGVSFRNGIAHTPDSFTASWFRNKKGYVVEKE